MKLARPDIRHPRIVLAGSPGGDDVGLVAALRKRGLHAHWLSWDDPRTLDADLVILRDSSGRRGVFDVDEASTKPVECSRRRRLERRSALSARPWPRGSARAARPSSVRLRGSHRAGFHRRRPVPRIHSRHSPVDADFELWDLGQAALQAAADHLGIGVERVAVCPRRCHRRIR